jgi:hypothetical protein
MTPDDEATFITLWQQGASQQALAERLGVPVGTIKSRAAALARQGKIQPRPRGGAYPRQKAQGRGPSSRPVQNGAERGAVHATVQSSAVHALDTGAQTVHDGAELPIPAAVAAEFRRLWAAIDALRQDLHPPVQSTVQSLPEPLFEDPADNATERWNLYLKRGLRVRIEALALARGVAPSRVVQEILWHALEGHRHE